MLRGDSSRHWQGEYVGLPVHISELVQYMHVTTTCTVKVSFAMPQCAHAQARYTAVCICLSVSMK